VRFAPHLEEIALGIVTSLKRTVKEMLAWLGKPRPQSYEEQIYVSLIRRGDVCFDVGANNGDVSLLLARLAGYSGSVVAFEPVWPMYAQMCRHLQRDIHLKAPIIPLPIGLADTDRDATIQVPDGNFGFGSMSSAIEWKSALSSTMAETKIASYEVRLQSMDSFLAASSLPKPVFMKIDVEGAELLVLRGANEMFSRGARPLMLIEVFAPWERAFGYRPWELLSWLLERGYRLLFACPNGLVEHVPTESGPFPPEYEMGYNVVAFLPEIHSERIGALKHLRAGAGGRLLPMDPSSGPNRIA
jgi:FkbM family methyltransferase